MKAVYFQILLIVITGNLFSIMAQEDVKLNSRVEGKKINLSHIEPGSNKLKEAVLFIHGATFPSALASEFRMNGISWADNLAKAGFDVFALDFLGYGKSDRYDYMFGKSVKYADSSGGRDVVKDIDIAISFIQKNLNFEKVHLIGHSWGATVSGHYATMYSEKINKLVLFAPFVQKSESTTLSKPTMFYIDKTPKQRVEEFINGIPKGELMTLEEDVLTKWEKTWQESDSTAIDRSPVSIRYPSAWKKDLYDCWNGNCFFDPTKINNPTLLIRGEWDSALDEEDANKTFMEIKNTTFKKYVVIEKSTHVMHLEKNRYQLYDEVLNFLRLK